MSRGQSDRFIVDGYAENPEWLEIAGEIAETPRSATQISGATGIPLTRVRRHIRGMREAGLVETIMRKSKRGAVENFNFLPGGLLQQPEEIAELSLEERRRLYGNILKIVLTEASRALVTHATDRGLGRNDVAVVRIPISTDEAGWDELAKLHYEFYERIMETRKRIGERLEKERGETFKASSVLLLFDAETTD